MMRDLLITVPGDCPIVMGGGERWRLIITSILHPSVTSTPSPRVVFFHLSAGRNDEYIC